MYLDYKLLLFNLDDDADIIMIKSVLFTRYRPYDDYDITWEFPEEVDSWNFYLGFQTMYSLNDTLEGFMPTAIELGTNLPFTEARCNMGGMTIEKRSKQI